MFFFLFPDTATTEIYTLSLHDALPISHAELGAAVADHHAAGDDARRAGDRVGLLLVDGEDVPDRSEEHTSELQSLRHLVCRLLLEKKKKRKKMTTAERQRIHVDQQRKT